MTTAAYKFNESLSRNRDTSMAERQEPLKAIYLEIPDKARIVDHARTTSARVPATTALYGEVLAGEEAGTPYAVGVHTAVGGNGDFPVPGEILSAAIAACLDSCIRIIANRLGMCLKHLEVAVAASVDVRGTLRVDTTVPVGFQNIDIEVDIETVTPIPEANMKALLVAAENSCVVLQTLRTAPAILVSRKASQNARRVA